MQFPAVSKKDPVLNEIVQHIERQENYLGKARSVYVGELEEQKVYWIIFDKRDFDIGIEDNIIKFEENLKKRNNVSVSCFWLNEHEGNDKDLGECVYRRR